MNGGGLASGAEPGTSAVYTSTNGNWNGTATFTPTDGSTPASTVTVGDWAGVYNDGATTPVYIARVVTVAAGANGVITLSTTAKSGTAPTSSATTRTIAVGGAWAGPSGAVGFPFNFVTSAMTTAGGDAARVNFKNDQTYSITAAMTHSLNGPIVFQGYTTTFGDLGRATVNGGTSGVSYVLLNFSGADIVLADFIFDHNGATGSASGIAGGTLRNQINRCVFRNMLGAGAAEGMYVECEAYANNTGNNANSGGFISTGFVLRCVNCISHDNAGVNSNGYYNQSSDFTAINCIAAHNGSHGFNMNNIVGQVVLNSCDTYNNGGSGLRKQGGSSCPVLVRNSNFIKNGAWGIDLSGSSSGVEGTLYNNGYGAGTQVNVSGKVNSGSLYEVGAVTYAANVTPWVDPANGDFRINLAAAQGTGRGAFVSLMAGFAGTVGYPDIGAAQHLDSGGGGGAGGVSRGRAMTGM